MLKLIGSLVIISCFLISSSWAQVNCPAGATKLYSCSNFPTAGDEVLAVCQSGNQIEYILEDGALSVHEEVTVSENTESPECQVYTPVTAQPEVNDITLHSMSICDLETVVISYVWLGGAMPGIYLCQ